MLTCNCAIVAGVDAALHGFMSHDGILAYLTAYVANTSLSKACHDDCYLSLKSSAFIVRMLAQIEASAEY